MSKKKKRILNGVGAFFAVALLTAIIAFYPMLTMRPTETGAVAHTSVYAIKNATVAVYFIDTGEGIIMVDAGAYADALQEDMNLEGISVEDIKWILLTHSDADHVAALPLFPDAEIYIGEDEIGHLNGSVKRNASGFTSLPDGVDAERLITLKDGAELSLGGLPVQCFLTAGHTVGSVTYLVDEQHLFTGDAFSVTDGKMSVHPFSMDEAFAAGSISALKGLVASTKLTFTGHYGVFAAGELS